MSQGDEKLVCACAEGVSMAIYAQGERTTLMRRLKRCKLEASGRVCEHRPPGQNRTTENNLDQQHCFCASPGRSSSCVIHVQLARLCGRRFPPLDDCRSWHQHGLPSVAHSPVISSAFGPRVFLCCLWHVDASRW